VTVLACVAASALGAAAAQAKTSWVTTATKAVPTGSGVTRAGALTGSTPMTIHAVLGLRNASALHRDIAAGDTLSASSFKQQFAPTAAQVSLVKSYLKGAGLTVTSVTPNNVIVSATGKASAVQSAFHTTLDSVTANGHTGYANLTGAEVPSQLGSIVVSVLGLNDVYAMHTTLAAAKNPPSSCTISGVSYLCDYNPAGFQQAYDATGTPTGSKTNEAIFAEGDLTQVVTDLRTEEQANGLPKVPVTIDRTGVASTDTSGADEWDMDTQYSTGMAQTVKNLRLYDATSLSDSDLALSFADFAAQDTAKAGSASFGECEAEAYLDGSMLADDETFAEAAVQGQTVFASAGDTGGFCAVAPTNGVPAGVPDVNYPASSPYVVSAGGTSLLTNANGSYDEELAWTAGGGGISYFESAPGWQSGDGVIGTIGSEADLRTLPDVAMDADPNTGANVYVDGAPEVVGGTSLSSPLALGVWDRIESGHGNAVPFASPLLYAQNGTAAFHDVTLGDTGPYPATPGYDLATGVGSFDVAKADSLIK
jgi:subtilase family serine protease